MLYYGSGWESNPPGSFSEATLGLKPRTVTRSAYTPRVRYTDCATVINGCQWYATGVRFTIYTCRLFVMAIETFATHFRVCVVNRHQ